jgi:hypothetical protein
MATKKAVMALADQLHATIKDDGMTLELEAPAGYIVAPEQHAWVYDVSDGRDGVWTAIMQDLK